MKHDLQRRRYSEEARRVTRRQVAAPLEGMPSGNLRPWREVVTPHRDVASGEYQQAEFAADLHQVWRGEAEDEYGKPEEFKFYKDCEPKPDIQPVSREDLIKAIRKCHQTLWGGGKLSPHAVRLNPDASLKSTNCRETRGRTRPPILSWMSTNPLVCVSGVT